MRQLKMSCPTWIYTDCPPVNEFSLSQGLDETFLQYCRNFVYVNFVVCLFGAVKVKNKKKKNKIKYCLPSSDARENVVWMKASDYSGCME